MRTFTDLSEPVADKAFVERFWAKVDRRGADGCWLWRGAKRSGGYGGVAWWKGRTLLTGRVAWALAHGPDSAESRVAHRCRNKLCVNPRHHVSGPGFWTGEADPGVQSEGRSRTVNLKDGVDAAEGAVTERTTEGERQ